MKTAITIPSTAGARTQKHIDCIGKESRQPKSGLPVYLLFGTNGHPVLIGSFGSLDDALCHGDGNLVIESGMNCCPQPFHRAFTLAAYPDGAPFWTETTVESGVSRALAAFLDPFMDNVEPRIATGWKATFSTTAALQHEAEEMEIEASLSDNGNIRE